MLDREKMKSRSHQAIDIFTNEGVPLAASITPRRSAMYLIAHANLIEIPNHA